MYINILYVLYNLYIYIKDIYIYIYIYISPNAVQYYLHTFCLKSRYHYLYSGHSKILLLENIVYTKSEIKDKI